VKDCLKDTQVSITLLTMTVTPRMVASLVLLALSMQVVPSIGIAHRGKSALLLIDVQNCFLTAECTSTGNEGSLSVPACGILPKINAIMEEKSCLFDEVIYTQDFHPSNHISFGSTHGLAPFAHLGGKGGLPMKCIKADSGLTKDGACCPLAFLEPSMDCEKHLCPPSDWSYMEKNPDIITGNSACTVCKDDPDKCFDQEQAMWTDHCLQDGDSDFPTGLKFNKDTSTVIQKGSNQYVDAYSGFMDNTQTLKTSLDDVLKAKGITKLFVAGIATDVCVQWTVTDALGSNTEDYTVTVIKDATAAVLGSEANYKASMGIMAAEGAKIVTADDVLAMECPNTAMKCADVKKAFKAAGCCGNPNAMISGMSMK